MICGNKQSLDIVRHHKYQVQKKQEGLQVPYELMQQGFAQTAKL